MGWNYRLVKHSITEADGSEVVYYQMHEAYYEDGNIKPSGDPHALTTAPASLLAQSESQMRTMLQRMLKAIDKPTLEFKKVEKTLKNSSDPVDSLIET